MEEGNKKRFQRVAATKPTMIQWFMLLTAFGARKAFDAGQKLIAKNHNLMTALLWAVVAFFLVVLLSTMLQCYFEYLSSSSTFLAILLILILAGVVLVLALTPLSRTVATTTLGLWVITITVVVLFHCQNQLIANAMLGRIKKSKEKYKPRRGVPKIIQKWVASCRDTGLCCRCAQFNL